jgi:hypothetical protein
MSVTAISMDSLSEITKNLANAITKNTHAFFIEKSVM